MIESGLGLLNSNNILNRIFRTHILSYFLTGPEPERDLAAEEAEAERLRTETTQPTSWRQRLNNLNHRYAMAMGLQEN